MPDFFLKINDVDFLLINSSGDRLIISSVVPVTGGQTIPFGDVPASDGVTLGNVSASEGLSFGDAKG